MSCSIAAETETAIGAASDTSTGTDGTEEAPDISSVWELRKYLWASNFRPVAIYNSNAPVPSAGKRPKGAGWTDSARKNPPAAVVGAPEKDALNTGILCDGLQAVDIDVDEQAVVDQLVELAETVFGPAPMRVRANSARRLLLYRAAVGEPGKQAISGTNGKVEVLGRGQQFVAFGLHPSGAQLEWSPAGPGETTLEKLSPVSEEQVHQFLGRTQELLGVMDPVENKSLALPTSASVADPVDVVAALQAIPNDGPSNWDYWNRIGMATWAATSGGPIGHGAWLEWSRRNASFNEANCEERWRNYAKSPPTRLTAEALFIEARRVQSSWRKPSIFQPSVDNGAPPFRVYSAAELQDLELRPNEIVLEPWLRQKGLALIYGQRGIGKTQLTLAVAHAIASGGEILGWRALRPHRVLIIDGEMPAYSLRDRLSAIHLGNPPGTLKILPLDLQERNLDLSDEVHQAQLERELDRHMAEVIFVDNISTLSRMSRENDAESWAPIQEWALRQRRLGRTVVFIHHAGKKGLQRGTSKREDVLNTVIALRQPSDYQPEQGARFEVHFEKTRDFMGEAAKPFEAALVGGAWRTEDLTDARKEQVVELRRRGTSLRDIEKITGTSKSTVHRMVSDIQNENVLEVEPRPDCPTVPDRGRPLVGQGSPSKDRRIKSGRGRGGGTASLGPTGVPNASLIGTTLQMQGGSSHSDR